MSELTPTYMREDRWLRLGIPIDSTKLNGMLDDVATAINSMVGGGVSHVFEPGWGIQYDRNEKASGKWSHPIRADVAVDLLSINIESTTGITFSDTEFNIVSLDPDSYAFGSKFLHLGLTFTFATSAPAVRHPAHASASNDLEIVFREAADFADMTLADGTVRNAESRGHHVLAVNNVVDYPTAAGDAYRGCVVRNINQSFAIRIGTGLTIGAGSRVSVRIAGMDY